MAGHVFDNAPAPPELVEAWDYRGWGVNVLDLPLGTFPVMRTVYSTYSILKAYTSAVGKTAEWSTRNPQAWAYVSSILQARRAQRKGG